MANSEHFSFGLFNPIMHTVKSLGNLLHAISNISYLLVHANQDINFILKLTDSAQTWRKEYSSHFAVQF